jgi:hypothetical protein
MVIAFPGMQNVRDLSNFLTNLLPTPCADQYVVKAVAEDLERYTDSTGLSTGAVGTLTFAGVCSSAAGAFATLGNAAGTHVILAGHSYGGALAAAAGQALDTVSYDVDGTSTGRPLVITYGTPKVFIADWSSASQYEGGHEWRIATSIGKRTDPITHWLPWMYPSSNVSIVMRVKLPYRAVINSINPARFRSPIQWAKWDKKRKPAGVKKEVEYAAQYAACIPLWAAFAIAQKAGVFDDRLMGKIFTIMDATVFLRPLLDVLTLLLHPVDRYRQFASVNQLTWTVAG